MNAYKKIWKNYTTNKRLIEFYGYGDACLLSVFHFGERMESLCQGQNRYNDLISIHYIE